MRCGRRWRRCCCGLRSASRLGHGLALMARMLPQLPWTGWEWVAQWAAVFLLLAALPH
jgi:hypothetical protein